MNTCSNISCHTDMPSSGSHLTPSCPQWARTRSPNAIGSASRLLLLLLVTIGLCGLPQQSRALTFLNPTLPAVQRPAGSDECVGINIEKSGRVCRPNAMGVQTGLAVWGDEEHKVTFPKDKNGGQITISDFIAPHTGYIALTMIRCQGRSSRCTYANYTGSASPFEEKKIWKKGERVTGTLDDGGTYDMFAADAGPESVCYVLVQTGENGAYPIFRTSDPMMCQDVQPVPQPDTCKLADGGGTLNVELGNISRNDLTTGTSTHKVTKTINVTCESDSTLDVSTTFKYVNMPGAPDAVVTSADGLGVSIKYNGTSIAPDTEIPGSFTSGNNTITLDFTPVRSTTVPVNEIATGNFTSDVVMIITMQ